MAKTAQELVSFVKSQAGLPYWYGTFGQVATESLLDAKAKQYPKYYGNDREAIAKRCHLGKRVHDCIGLVKHYLWLTSDGGVKYDSKTDWSANTTYNKAKVKGSIKTMPDRAGLCVRYDGHVGVYIGDGYVVEARGFDYGVVVTRLKDRAWTHWYEHPLISYSTSSSSSSSKPVEIGCKVTIKAGAVYGGAARGIKVPSKYTDGDKFTVSKIQTNNGQKEALLKELVSWVAVKYLTRV